MSAAKTLDLASIDVVILAGQRPGPDALCEHAGVEFKADIPVAGTPMVERVRQALRGAGLSEPFSLSGYPSEKNGFTSRSGGRGPADSALISIDSFPSLLTTCDHALLSVEIASEFLEMATATGADFVIGLASEDTILSAYPDTKRTFLRFADVAVSGCNLFYVANEDGLEAVRFWRQAQDFRKQPLRLAQKVGARLAYDYARGRLTLSKALSGASRRLGVTIDAVLLSHAEAAIDVDKPSDLELVETILARRG